MSEGSGFDEDNLTLHYVRVDVISASSLRNADLIGASDPFVEVKVQGLVRTTPVIQDNLNPVWNSQFAFFVQDRPDVVDLVLLDEDDNKKNDLLGEAVIQLAGLWEKGEGSWAGELPVIYKGAQKGSIKVGVYVRMMKPVHTEKQLVLTTEKLASSEQLAQEQAELAKAKDKQLSDTEAEKLRLSLVALEKEKEAANTVVEKQRIQELADAKQAELKVVEEERAKVAQELQTKDEELQVKYKALEEAQHMLRENKNDEDYLVLHLVHLEVLKATGLRNADLVGKSDPFVEAVVQGLTRTTPVIQDTLDPIWNSTFAYYVQCMPKVATFRLWDEDDHGKNDLLGDCELDLTELFRTKKTFEGEIPVIYKKKEAGKLYLRCSCKIMHPVQTEKDLELTKGKLVETEGVLGQKEAEVVETKGKLELTAAEKQKAVEDLERKQAQLAATKRLLEDNKNDQDYLLLFLIHADVISAKGLRNADLVGLSDPFCEAVVSGFTRTTPVVENNLNPVWNSSFAYYVQKQPEVIDFILWDQDDHGKNDALGEAQLSLTDLFRTGKDFQGDLPVMFKGKQSGSVQVRVYCRALHPLKTENKLAETEKALSSTEQALNSTKTELQGRFKEVETLAMGNADAKRKLDDLLTSVDQLQRQNAYLRDKFETAPRLISLRVTVKGARGLRNADVLSLSDPYAVVQVGTLSSTTKTIKDNLNPNWEESFSFLIDTAIQPPPRNIGVKLYDADSEDPNELKADLLGETIIELADVAKEQGRELTYEQGVIYKGEKKGSVIVAIEWRELRGVVPTGDDEKDFASRPKSTSSSSSSAAGGPGLLSRMGTSVRGALNKVMNSATAKKKPAGTGAAAAGPASPTSPAPASPTSPASPTLADAPQVAEE